MPRKPFNPDLIAPPPPGETAEQRPLSVSELTAMVKRALARLPANLAVAGEISNFSRSPAGHLYFTLKDPGACVDCVMWRSTAARLKFQPTDGLAVVAFGQIDVYEPRGRYQLYVARLLPAGRGELELAFRQLHEKLMRLGWFEAARKRPIPLIPRIIGIVTSTTGAALRDILRTLAIRWPTFHAVVADARVQGEAAGPSIVAAIERINRHAAAGEPIDVLIVARGGGSLEDLWAFNTEPVARAVLESTVPVVTGIGHEVDTTIADLVADVRAATPTAAAQRVVPDRRELARRLADTADRLGAALRDTLADLAHRLAVCARHETFRRPDTLLRSHRQGLDEWSGRLTRGQRDLLSALARTLADRATRLERRHPRALLAGRWRVLETLAGKLRWGQGRVNLSAERQLGELVRRLAACSPAVRLAQAVQKTDQAAGLLRSSMRRGLVRRAELLDARARQLDAYNPRAVLARGYSMTRLKAADTLVTAADQLRPGDRLISEFAVGRAESKVVATTGVGGRKSEVGEQELGAEGRNSSLCLPPIPGPRTPKPRAARQSSPARDQMPLFDNGASDGQETR